MKKCNKLDKTFGPMAFSGVIISLFLLCSFLYEMLSKGEFSIKSKYEINNTILLIICVLVFLFGLFIGFTVTYTRIDYENKRIKYATKFFGIIPIGKWTYLTPDMKLGLKASTERWGAYSMSNRSTSLNYNDLKIVLYDAKRTEIIPVKKIKKEKLAEAELEKLSKLLKLDIIK